MMARADQVQNEMQDVLFGWWLKCCVLVCYRLHGGVYLDDELLVVEYRRRSKQTWFTKLFAGPKTFGDLSKLSMRATAKFAIRCYGTRRVERPGWWTRWLYLQWEKSASASAIDQLEAD